MNTWSLTLPPLERALLREFERLHEEWRVASEAADAIDSTRLSFDQQEEVQRLLEYRLAADRLHQQAMQLLRDTPI
jgi:hypothetical protein